MNPGSYKTVDFTKTFNPSVTGVYQTLSTGTELIVIPQGAPRKLYTYQLNANVQSQWYVLDYSSYGYQITEGVLIDSSLYFIIDNISILKYSSSIFVLSSFQPSFVMVGNLGTTQAYSTDNGLTWNSLAYPLPGYWQSVAYGNGVFVIVGQPVKRIQPIMESHGLLWRRLYQIFGVVSHLETVFLSLQLFSMMYNRIHLITDSHGHM
jgi:hypothetical protein